MKKNIRILKWTGKSYPVLTRMGEEFLQNVETDKETFSTIDYGDVRIAAFREMNVSFGAIPADKTMRNLVSEAVAAKSKAKVQLHDNLARYTNLLLLVNNNELREQLKYHLGRKGGRSDINVRHYAEDVVNQYKKNSGAFAAVGLDTEGMDHFEAVYMNYALALKKVAEAKKERNRTADKRATLANELFAEVQYVSRAGSFLFWNSRAKLMHYSLNNAYLFPVSRKHTADGRPPGF